MNKRDHSLLPVCISIIDNRAQINQISLVYFVAARRNSKRRIRLANLSERECADTCEPLGQMPPLVRQGTHHPGCTVALWGDWGKNVASRRMLSQANRWCAPNASPLPRRLESISKSKTIRCMGSKEINFLMSLDNGFGNFACLIVTAFRHKH